MYMNADSAVLNYHALIITDDIAHLLPTLNAPDNNHRLNPHCMHALHLECKLHALHPFRSQGSY